MEEFPPPLGLGVALLVPAASPSQVRGGFGVGLENICLTHCSGNLKIEGSGCLPPDLQA